MYLVGALTMLGGTRREWEHWALHQINVVYLKRATTPDVFNQKQDDFQKHKSPVAFISPFFMKETINLRFNGWRTNINFI